jgi:predicted RNA-binding Zn-ribbon protein involved in translation (DUF1610 family)
MAISFSCQHCGRKLKAPDNAVGKASKCPGCGSSVVCPEPVYEAELLETPRGGPNAFDDLDTDKPYAMTAEPTEAPTGEVRRPCPMCGEMIVATAAKCRFCGEIFDETLKKAGKGGKKGKTKTIAAVQRNLMTCILIQIVTFIGLFVLRSMVAQSHDPLLSLLLLCDSIALIVVAIGGVVCTFILAMRLYSTGVGILLGVLSMVPYLGFLILLMVNQKATAHLREHGYEVGLMGAKAS